MMKDSTAAILSIAQHCARQAAAVKREDAIRWERDDKVSCVGEGIHNHSNGTLENNQPNFRKVFVSLP
jgi:hypothetical protein